MPVNTIFLIALAALAALGFVFFKYFIGNKNINRTTYFLAGLRFISILIILILLINPGIKQQTIEVEKAGLLIAIDQSRSINYSEQTGNVQDYINSLKEDKDLQTRFSIQSFGFGNEVTPVNGESLEFDQPQTNISNALKNLERLKASERNAIVIVTDGNQTVGEDYSFFRSNENTGIFPVVVGDTTAQLDLLISNLNVNKYAFLNNKFPVEVLLNYKGTEAVESTFELRSGNRVLFTKPIKFSPADNSEVINTTLPASKLGVNFFEAFITPLAGEKNITNNTRKFGVEVIDERTSVLILTSVSHPDLGMLKKAIEQNEQREAEIKNISDYNNLNIADFQLIVLFQPNNSFKKVFEDINSQSLNSFVITGSETDWNFLNSVQTHVKKDFTYQNQEIFGIYNENFSTFQFDDIGFRTFSPLEDSFGNLEVLDESLNSLLFQQVEGIETRNPLLAVLERNSTKHGFLFGENIWKWRSQSFVERGSFEYFDSFISKVVQYLAATQKRDRLTVESESVYLENENITINAQYFDENYQFNPNGQLEVQIENLENGTKVASAMLNEGNRFKFEIQNLDAGDYKFEVKELTSGIARQGSFTVLEYNVEQQFTSANLDKLRGLAQNNLKEVFFLNAPGELKNRLLEDERYVSIQKSRQKTVPLIEWKLLLLLLVLSLSTEWFVRKYFGLI